MLYEVITLNLIQQLLSISKTMSNRSLNLHATHFYLSLFNSLNASDVITSYSIHYTKLYDFPTRAADGART